MQLNLCDSVCSNVLSDTDAREYREKYGRTGLNYQWRVRFRRSSKAPIGNLASPLRFKCIV